MSYSRWSNSRWYTFWTTFSEDMEFKLPTKKLKDNQVIEVCGFPSLFFSYGEFRQVGIDQILLEVKLVFQDATEEELEELGVYFQRFIDDVDGRFKSFFYYEWWIPFRYNVWMYLREVKKHILNGFKRTVRFLNSFDAHPIGDLKDVSAEEINEALKKKGIR
jgi:hypothetical protein